MRELSLSGVTIHHSSLTLGLIITTLNMLL